MSTGYICLNKMLSDSTDIQNFGEHENCVHNHRIVLIYCQHTACCQLLKTLALKSFVKIFGWVSVI